MLSVSRPRLSLDGGWQLALVDVPGRAPDEVVDVTVPGSWTVQVPGSELSHGTVVYRRTFQVPARWVGEQRLVLRFGAVNHAASVSVNGHHLGTHAGGWTPFDVDLPQGVLTGEDELLEVTVAYPPLMASPDGTPGMQETPHGKQSWYGSNAGIWQPVVLERRSPVHLLDAVVRADAGTGEIVVRAATTGAEGSDTGRDLSATVVVVDRDAATEAGRATVPTVPGAAITVRVPVVNLRMWSPDQPVLYDVTIKLDGPDGPLDVVGQVTGFRTVATADGQVVLNGRPVEIRGVLDQDYHPGSETRPASRDELVRLFRATKQLGFNLLRCHIKRPDPMYFEVADEVGLLVWAELPSWQILTPRSAAAAEDLLCAMVELDGHHPAIVAWSVVNESWGVDLRAADQRAWMAATQQRIKTLAGDSLVVDNSACDPNFHVRTDLADFHAYRGIPERRASWDAWVDELAGRPAWLFSPHGDASSTGEEPLVVSEFGNWGLPDAEHVRSDDGGYEWWAEAGRDWAFGAAHATGVVERFHRLGLDDVFGSWAAFVDATQRHQLLATRYQIGSIRRRPEIGGYVLTQLSDVQWEANGLFDMDRRPRRFLDELAMATSPQGVVVRPSSYSVWAGESVDLVIDVVPQRAPGPGENWQVRLCSTGTGQLFDVPAHRRTTITAKVGMPNDSPAMVPVTAELLIDGVAAARDIADLAVLPPLSQGTRRVTLDDRQLVPWLSAIDVPVTLHDRHQLLITRRFGADAQGHARDGGRVLVLAEDDDALGDAFAAPLLARLSPREGDGDWVPRFDWLRRSGPFAALPGGPLLDLSFESVVGDLVIDFLPAPLRPAHLHSAMFAGWLQHRASTSLTVPWSRGAVTISTFRLRDPAAGDAVAATLARALIDVAER